MSKIQEVMNFNFGGHHDLAVMVKKLEATGMFSDKHSRELVIGLRLLHHVAKSILTMRLSRLLLLLSMPLRRV